MYGILKFLVFGRRLNRAEECRLDELTDVRTVLVFGGGAGKVLEHSFFTDVSVQIVFVDASSRMLSIAKERANKLGLVKVRFIRGTQLDLSDESFDLILCPFVLDVFSDDELPEVLTILSSRLNETGRLIVTDFTKGVTATNQWLVPFMYFFFRLAGALSVKNIGAIETSLRAHFRIENKKYFLNQKVASWMCSKG